MSKKIVIVSGGRNFGDRAKVEFYLNSIAKHHEVELVVGDAKGADALATAWAKKTDTPRVVFEAKWKEHGRGAGPRRNKEMADYASQQGDPAMLLAFWDGQSKGTFNMIQLAHKAQIPVRVVMFQVDTIIFAEKENGNHYWVDDKELVDAYMAHIESDEKTETIERSGGHFDRVIRERMADGRVLRWERHPAAHKDFMTMVYLEAEEI